MKRIQISFFASLLLMFIGLSIISPVFATLEWPLSEGETIDWLYYYNFSQKTADNDTYLSINFQVTMEMTEIKNAVWYSMNWTNVSIESNNTDLSSSYEIWCTGKQIIENETIPFESMYKIEFPMSIEQINPPLVMQDATWHDFQEDLLAYDNYTRDVLLASNIVSEEHAGAQNITHSFTGSTSITGYNMDYEINSLLEGENRQIRYSERCQYTIDGVLKEFYFNRTREFGSIQKYDEAYLGNLNFLPDSTGFSIPNYSISIFVVLCVISIIGLWGITNRQRWRQNN